MVNVFNNGVSDTNADSSAFLVCLFDAQRRINPYGSLALDSFVLNMVWMEKVIICNV